MIETFLPALDLLVTDYLTADPERTARVLRLMAANFMFTEVEPAVFARNHLSSMLDTGKSVRILQSDPENAFVDTNGIAALVAHTSEEILKASSFVPDTLLSPELAKSSSPQDAPFARAFNGVTAFEYLGAHPRLMKRFAAAMAPFSKLVNPDIGSEKLTGTSLPHLPLYLVDHDTGSLRSFHLC